MDLEKFGWSIYIAAAPGVILGMIYGGAYQLWEREKIDADYKQSLGADNKED